MLVDDEQIVIDDLRSLVDWRALGYEIVGTARNGASALAKAAELRPDLVLSDIRMPRIDGVQLAGLLKRQRPGVAVILISSWAEFEYARSALKYGVEDYLLKHDISPESLSLLLAERRDAIERQRERDRLLIGRYAAESFLGAGRPAAVPEEGRAAELESEGRLFSVIAEEPPIPLGSSPARPQLSAGELEKLLGEFRCGGLELESLAELGAGRSLAILGREGAAPETPSAREAALEIRKLLCSASGRSFSVFYFSRPMPLSRAGAIFRRDERVFDVRYFDGPSRAVDIEDAGFGVSAHDIDFGLGGLEEALRSRDAEAFGAAVAELFDPIAKERNVAGLLFASSQAFAAFSRCAWSILGPRAAELAALRPDEQASLLALADLRSFLESRVAAFFAAIGEGGPAVGLSQPTRRAIDYVRRNYPDAGLDLRRVADAIGLSTARLGVVFKQDTGLTLHAYIVDLRLEAAKRLLKGSAFKVYEIAEKSGFGSSQHFSQVFQKAEGMTPLAFRDRD